MIAYRVSRPALEARIEQEAPGWLARAAQRTQDFREKGRYAESNSIWSEVKAVYMSLQNEKCAFCERKLEALRYGKVEQDVEHFRPKGRVRAWKAPVSLRKQGINLTAAPAEDKGYHLLPYHPFNYSAACKPCNSILKKDYFPIAGAYDLGGDEPLALVAENPLLIYPLGDFDADPEALLGFIGLSPHARAQSGYERARALVTIEFFKLDDVSGRKNLFRARAVVVLALYPQLEKLAQGQGGEDARRIVDGFTSAAAEHANCARSFKALYDNDRLKAEAVFKAATKFITSIS